MGRREPTKSLVCREIPSFVFVIEKTPCLFACPNCGTVRQPAKFAPHLEKCRGMSVREPRRAATKRPVWREKYLHLFVLLWNNPCLFACPNCGTVRQPAKFAPHLEKCMDMGQRTKK